jgi:hypothetical protein
MRQGHFYWFAGANNLPSDGQNRSRDLLAAVVCEPRSVKIDFGVLELHSRPLLRERSFS